MRGYLNRLCLGFAAVSLLACGARVARGDLLGYPLPGDPDMNGVTGNLTLSNFVQDPYPPSRTFPNPLGGQPWLTAMFTGPVGGTTATLTLTASDWQTADIAVTRWVFNSTLSTNDFSITTSGSDPNYSGPPQTGSSAGFDTLGTFSFAMDWTGWSMSSPGFTDGVTEKFTITFLKVGNVQYTYDPSEFDVSNTRVAGAATNGGAISAAIISEDYLMDTPEPSRAAGLAGMSIVGGIGLCFGFARKRKPLVC